MFYFLQIGNQIAYVKFVSLLRIEEKCYSIIILNIFARSMNKLSV